jgi:hypothetical protein
MATSAGDIQPTDHIPKQKNSTRANNLSGFLATNKKTKPENQEKSQSHNDDRNKDNGKREKVNNGHKQKIPSKGTKKS